MPTFPALPTDFYSITDYGAVSGEDCTAALTACFKAAKSAGRASYIPPGTWYHSDTLTLNGQRLFGAGRASILAASNPDRSALYLTGNGPQVQNLQISCGATRRNNDGAATGIFIDRATSFLVENIIVARSSGAGIMNWGGGNGTIRCCYVDHSWADAIHNTFGAHDIVIEYNKTFNSGDDGIAVVSYSDSGMCRAIRAHHNTIVENLWGRGMSIVGGEGIVFEYNHIEKTAGDIAGIYVASEKVYETEGVDGAEVRYNTVWGCGGPKTGHGAIHVFSDTGSAVENISLHHNQTIDPNGAHYVANGAGLVTGAIANAQMYSDRSHVQFGNSVGSGLSFSGTRQSVSALPGETAPYEAGPGFIDDAYAVAAPEPEPEPVPPEPATLDTVMAALTEIRDTLVRIEGKIDGA